MLTFTKTDVSNPDFIALVHLLDEGLKITDGEEFGFYNQFNQLDDIKYVLLAYEEGQAVGCGAIKEYDADTMEVKRMFVREEARGKRIATRILKALEDWTQELGYTQNILETGVRQYAAIALYERCDYQRIPNFGQYIGAKDSVCFSKSLSKGIGKK